VGGQIETPNNKFFPENNLQWHQGEVGQELIREVKQQELCTQKSC